MPKRNFFRGLAEQCVDNIVSNMDTVWCKEFLTGLFGQSHWLYVMGPFDTLPFDLVHRIFVRLKDRKMLRKHHIYLLINPYLKRLDVSRESSNEIGLILQLLGTRCRQLQHLDLSFTTRFPKITFLQEFPSFSKRLTSLDLSRVHSVNDDVAGVIGVYGRHLVNLDLSSTSVTDIGLACLVHSQDLEGQPCVRYGQCVHLKSVGLLDCPVSADGVSKVIGKLTQMVDLRYEDSVEAIFLHLQNSPGQSHLLLKSLFSRNPKIDDDSFHAVVRVCPRIISLYASCYESMNCGSLLPLANKMKGELQEIHITNETGVAEISILNTLTPVLAFHGPTIVSLNLAEVAEVSIQVIVEYCPEMVHLCLQFNTAFCKGDDILRKGSSKKVVKRSPEKLKTLKLLCLEKSEFDLLPNSPDSEDLQSLLACSTLKSLELSHCENLDDAVFATVFEQHEFKKLESLSLTSCHNISFISLFEFLTSINNLRRVQLVQCEDIGLCDIQKYKKILTKKKMLKHVSIEWL